jgi:hypothetical protein
VGGPVTSIADYNAELERKLWLFAVPGDNRVYLRRPARVLRTFKEKGMTYCM